MYAAAISRKNNFSKHLRFKAILILIAAFVFGIACSESNDVSVSALKADNSRAALVNGVEAVGAPLYQVNCGSSNAASPFVGDTIGSGGTMRSIGDSIDLSAVTDPAPQAVYQSERYGNSNYTFSSLTPSDTYLVRLHFAELYQTAAGRRSFNVSINGDTVLSNFDIYAETGARFRAVVREYAVAANGSGQIMLNFTTNIDNATISGIEIFETVPGPTPGEPAYQVNCGSNNAASPFVGDTNGSGGTMAAFSDPIDLSDVTDPAPQSVYQSERFGNSTYTFPDLTPSENYLVRLHFTELYWTSAGSRNFNVLINGTTVLSNFDVYAVTGSRFKAVVREYVVAANGSGQIVINFTTNVDNATISGIEIYETSPVTPPDPGYRVNTGSNSGASPFVSDTNGSGGTMASFSEPIDLSDVTNPAPHSVYQSERYGNSSYTFPDLTPAEIYLVRLHFAELYWNSAGSRVFNVSINGTEVLSNFDVYIEAGNADHKAVIKEFPAAANDSGQIGINFQTVTDNAQICGIEVIEASFASQGDLFSSGGYHNCRIRESDGIIQCWGNDDNGEATPPEGVAFDSVEGGVYHTCGIRTADKEVECWGADFSGQSSPPAGVSFRSVSGYWQHSCGIRQADGEVQCWGDNADGQSTPPAGVVFDSVSTGAFHTCGVRNSDGEIQCWGRDDEGQSTPPSGVVFSAVSSGIDHTCGIRESDGEVLCWGAYASGQSSPPAGVAFSAIAAGGYHNCGIRQDDGEAQCWGRNFDGQADPPAGVTFDIISAGVFHSCGIRQDDGEVQCWGKNNNGQATPPYTPHVLSAGGFHTCGIQQSDGELHCWGYDSSGQATPPADVFFSAITGGSYHTCGVRYQDGKVECWGSDSVGQSTPPADVAFDSVSADYLHTCGIRKTDGIVQCWGWNDDGQSTPPTDVAFDSISAGTYHGCGVRKDDGEVQCWGHTGYGQSSPPAGVVFDSVSAGITHTCGVRQSDGEILCWGNDYEGQCSPPAGVAFLSVVTGGYHTCGLRESDGEVQCWGRDDDGQSSPPAGVSFLRISGGSFHNCGVRESDGEVQCWGRNDNGQSTPPAGLVVN